jgi:hypothetical protein
MEFVSCLIIRNNMHNRKGVKTPSFLTGLTGLTRFFDHFTYHVNPVNPV